MTAQADLGGNPVRHRVSMRNRPDGNHSLQASIAVAVIVSGESRPFVRSSRRIPATKMY
jgi:hypothetical protein